MSVSVSIIVPCYNVAAYLDQCMESLAGQSMEDIEIIWSMTVLPTVRRRYCANGGTGTAASG